MIRAVLSDLSFHMQVLFRGAKWDGPSSMPAAVGTGREINSLQLFVFVLHGRMNEWSLLSMQPAFIRELGLNLMIL